MFNNAICNIDFHSSSHCLKIRQITILSYNIIQHSVVFTTNSPLCFVEFPTVQIILSFKKGDVEKLSQKRIDRRKQYTRKVLKESLIELLKNKPIATISVKALCEKADINRSTFYAHY